MLEFLSPAWLSALDQAARRHALPPELFDGIDLVIEQRVTGAPHDVTYHVRLGDGAVTVTPGPADQPTIRFATDRATAAALAAGTESAQRAFMAGRLQVGGDLRTLTERQDAFAELSDVFAAVRDQTDLGVAPADHPPTTDPSPTR